MLGILCHLGAPLEGQAGSAPTYVRSCETAHLCIAKLKLMCCMCLSAVRHYQWLHMSLVLRVCNWSDVPYAMMSAVGCACACSMRLIGEGHIKLIDDGCHNIAVKLGGQHCCGDRLRTEVQYFLRASVPCVPGSGNECAACNAPARDIVDGPVRGVGPTGRFCQLVCQSYIQPTGALCVFGYHNP